MPAMMDPNFHRTVTYLCEHSANGALGIVINRPLEIDLGEIFERLSLADADPETARIPVLQGGPVQVERGFIIHESDEEWESSSRVTDLIRVTTSQDILAAMASGTGPKRSVIALGYAGWGAGQLEAELSANAWLSVPASTEILFETPFEKRWQDAAALLGIDLATLSTDAGHA
jgi:putative transcriptional regulator